jgi:putative ABC transport system substrate-binding protein
VTKEVQAAGHALRLQIQVLGARNETEIDAAFATLVRQGAQGANALLVQPDPVFSSSVTQIAALGTRLAVPAIYPSRDYAEAGGVMSYGADVSDEYRKVGVYTWRTQARPADLPISGRPSSSWSSI